MCSNIATMALISTYSQEVVWASDQLRGSPLGSFQELNIFLELGQNIIMLFSQASTYALEVSSCVLH